MRKLRESFNSFREAVFNTLFRARFRYDVFISYSHSDAKQYAENLKQQLSNLDFACFLDKEESPPGLSLGPTLEKALKKSAVLVLLATERALTRPYIEMEFGRFVTAKRKIIPINIAGALTRNNGEILTRAPWNIIEDQKLIWIDETPEAFAQQRPSPPIADGIDKLFKYTRRNVRVRAEIIGTAVLVLLAAFGAGFVIKGQAAEVSKQASLAETARKRATEQQGIAEKAAADAQEQLGYARDARLLAAEQRRIAGEAQKEAEHQQEIARLATIEAARQQQLARTATLEAQRQQAIAEQQLEHSRKLVYDSDLNFAQRAQERGDLTRLNEVLTNYLPRESAKDQPDRRGFEWFYYWRLANYKPFELGTVTDVGKIKISSDGKVLAAVSDTSTGQLKVWKLDHPDQIAEVRAHKDRITDLAISWDGATVATASADSTVKLWDIRTQDVKLIKTFRHAGGVGSVALSRDGKMLAAGLFNKSIRLWEIDKDTSLTTYEGFSDAVFSLAFAPDGTILITYDNQTLVQHSTSPPYQKVNDVFTNEKIGCVSFSADGKKLVAGVSANKVRIMEWPDWRNVRLLDAPGTTTGSACPNSLSADGETLVTLHDSKIYLLDVRSWSTLGSFNPGGSLWDLAVTPDGRRVAVRDSAGIKLWDLRGVQNQTTIFTESGADQIAFTSSGKVFATLGNKTVNFWDTQTLEPLPGLNDSTPTTAAMAFSRAGKVATGHEDGSLKLWNMQTREPSAVFKTCKEILSLSFAPDEQTLAVACGNGSVELWDTTRGQQLKTLAAHTGPVRSVVFSAEGKLASGSDDKTVRLWEPATGRQLWTGTTHQDSVLSLAFSADGKKLASASKDKTVKIWQVSTGNELRTLTGHKFEVLAVAFAPDGKTMATGGKDNLVKLWDPETGQEVVSFPDHTSRVTSVAFSPDGKTLATGSWDRTFKLWFAARNDEVTTAQPKP
ncbi:MAG TPA: TIR domain-containing protein [Pyrinomonadaceae bacterium]|nr:TIR domain-containing protein [Pyrinomonadaceae bacterium]